MHILQILSLESKIQLKHQQTNCSCSSVSRFSLTFIEGLRLFLDMAKIAIATIVKAQTTKLRVIRKSVALGLYCMEVVTFTDDTYRSLSDDTIIMSSSDKKEMVWIKRKSTNCSTRKAFLEKAVVELVHKFD